MNSSVHVAGIGVISAIGNTVAETLYSFEQERDGIACEHNLNTVHKNIPVAEVKMTNQQMAELNHVPVSISRTALLSLTAAREALKDAGITNISAFRTGFVSGNTVGGMDKSEDFFVNFLTDPNTGKLRYVFEHECGSVTEKVGDYLGINGYQTTISTACSSSANAIFYAARLIKNNILDMVVAGGVDSLTKFTLNGFNTLMILDRTRCKPFDEHRQGLNLGEGAGYLVLVSEKVIERAALKSYGILSGYKNSNDAFHQTASSPDGTGSFLAMKGALEQAGLEASAIDYINLHGTGTPNNDEAEGRAIQRVFGAVPPPMSSTKSFTGHTLGASGGIEAVFSVLALQYGMLFPNLRFETPIQDLGFVPQKHFEKGRQLNHVMSNSFGFGGNCSSLIFSKA